MNDARNLPGLPDGPTDPLTAAVNERDRGALQMVEQALREGRTMLAFQPVVLAVEQGRVAFHEGMIRVMEPDGRVIPAREFMNAVETRETGRLIDCAALRHGFAALAAVPDLRLSINMSARSIANSRWLKILRDGLQRDPTAGERLILEITESSAMMMPDTVTAFMDELHGEGVSFALDDFGAGYTAFRYFRDFFFEVVKIDGQFIRNVASNPDNQVLTRALTSIGKHFDMLVVAEAVESQADANWLSENGIDCLQGYHFGAPMVQPDWLTPGQRSWATTG